MDQSYPAHWEADVVLRDGGTAQLRPIRADDEGLMVDFYARTSAESKYYRFFSPYPRLSSRDLRRFTHVDYTDRVALIALVRGEMIAVVRYDRIEPVGLDGEPDGPVAEVAFLIEDEYQGRGLGSVLLEHIAAAARERGVRGFVAHVLPDNRRMIKVFREAGFASRHRVADGVVTLSLDIEPTETAVAVAQAREHRAEASSIRRLLAPRSVAVVGAGRRPDGVGRTVLEQILAAGFRGAVYPVNPAAAAAGAEIAGRPTYGSVLDVPDPVDLAVLAVPAPAVAGVVAECGRKGAHGLVVLSGGFAETGPDGLGRQRELVRLARGDGMRVVGPNSFGLLNTDPGVSLNATLAPALPPRGRVGMFAQSGALGIALLESAVRRGLGLSTFVSAGNRADVSGNDLLQYWEEDPATAVVLLYLESFGNPRKFSRLARRVARHKPVVVVKSGGSSHHVPVGHGGADVPVPDAAVDALFRQAGVIRVPTVTELFDVAQLLAAQPLPAGDRVAIVGNSDSLGLLAEDACLSVGLRPAAPVDLTTSAGAAELAAAVGGALADPDVDAVLAVVIPPLTGPAGALVDAVAELAAGAGAGGGAAKPVLAVRLGAAAEDVPPASLPSYQAPENAARALAEAVRYAAWRQRPAGEFPDLDGVDQRRARSLVRQALGDTPRRELDAGRAAELLTCYGILPRPGRDGADHPGRPVPVLVRVLDHPSFGAVISFGLGGVATELFGDLAYRILPLSRTDAADLVRAVRAAPLLFGYQGGEPVDVAALEDLLLRVSRLAEDLPEVAELELDPVLAGPDSCTVQHARVVLAASPDRLDLGPRALSRPR